MITIRQLLSRTFSRSGNKTEELKLLFIRKKTRMKSKVNDLVYFGFIFTIRCFNKLILFNLNSLVK